MTAVGERPAFGTHRPSALVSAPALKFAIGSVASLCAVLFPRLLAALTVQDQASVTFITPEYAVLAAGFSGLVGVVVTILEWKVPRTPRDTFMTTLGLPAILAGALSANQSTAALQEATKTQNALADALSSASGIPIESPTATRTGGGGRQGALADALVAPVYAASREAVPPVVRAQSPLAINVRQPRYVIVFDRAATQQDAQAKASQLGQRLSAMTPGHPVSVQVQPQGTAFLVVLGGGPRVKGDALVEAVRMRDTYHVTPVLVPASD
jgi:hypothetical protein